MGAPISPVKPLLSFLICLAICINHFSHSHSTPPALRKRMGDGTEMAITTFGGKSHCESAKPTVQGAGKISEDTFKPPNPSDVCIDPELTRTIGRKKNVGRPSFISEPVSLGSKYFFMLLKSFGVSPH